MQLTITLTKEQLAELAVAVAETMGAVSKNPMTVTAFAKAIGKDPKTVRNWIAAGIILKSPIPGDTLIPYSELEKYRTRTV